MLLKTKHTSIKRTFVTVGIFAIAMALLESAVVIYLRKIYFEGSFSPPFPPMDKYIFITELLREVGTLVMLVCIGILAGTTQREKFSYFLYAFAIWDIFYYIFLWALIDWPSSIIEWDILFLLPVPWTGPVICPIIIALNMVILSILLLIDKEKINGWIIVSMIAGCCIVLYSFTSEHWSYITAPWSTDSKGLIQINFEGFPERYNWLLFALGETFILLPLLYLYLNLDPSSDYKTKLR